MIFSNHLQIFFNSKRQRAARWMTALAPNHWSRVFWGKLASYLGETVKGIFIQVILWFFWKVTKQLLLKISNQWNSWITFSLALVVGCFLSQNKIYIDIYMEIYQILNGSQTFYFFEIFYVVFLFSSKALNIFRNQEERGQ